MLNYYGQINPGILKTIYPLVKALNSKLAIQEDLINESGPVL